MEGMEVLVFGGAPGRGASDRVLFEELVKERRGTLHYNESTVIGARVREIDNALDTDQTFAFGRLVAVGPGLRIVGAYNGLREGDVHCVEGDDELVGAPEFGEGSNDVWLAVAMV